MGSGDGQGKVIAMMGRREPRDVEDAQDCASSGFAYRCRCTRPAFDTRAEMLCRVNLHRPAIRERCANAICADSRLPPIRARHEVDVLSLTKGPSIPHGIKDDAIRAREDHD